MKEHTDASIEFFEDEFSISIGLLGLCFGQRSELVLQKSKELHRQDRDLGHDVAYVEYNGLGGYGILERLEQSSENSIDVILSKEAVNYRIEDTTFRFVFLEPIGAQFIKAQNFFAMAVSR